jgi:transposase
MERASAFDAVAAHLGACGQGDTLVARLALRLVEHLRVLTLEIDELTTEITERVATIAPSLLAIAGCGALTAAKIVGETAQVSRFRSKDAFARLNGTAPLPSPRWFWRHEDFPFRHRAHHIGADASLAGAPHEIWSVVPV